MTTDLLSLQKTINAASKRIEEAYHRAARAAGLSDSAFDILYALHVAGEGCSQRQLCELCFTRKQTVNSAIKRLQQNGTVRVEAGPGRATHIFLTAQGRKLVNNRVIPIIDAETTALNSLSPQQRTALSAGLPRYADALVKALDATGGRR
ncbi:MarR family winged helix-turn-helix transcriptional regulator [Actinomyces ruminicola]|uniref:DNA-binding transcriptional regulator, MarR family n=1 Tax=Actinomyces ruminicola TaxID=332524 RepID=A0A1G9SVV4_9ACTO|nr:MarR family transcriptional regulator [Actinomyces ruminicola]SDM39576.1 DNA-binding transcriptional regulator, MarR family [Actinomyces ruminicola]